MMGNKQFSGSDVGRPVAGTPWPTLCRGGWIRRSLVLLGVAMWGLALSACVADEASTTSLTPADSEQTRPVLTTSTTEPEPVADGTAADDDQAANQRQSTTSTARLEPLQGLKVTLVADGFDQPIYVGGAPGTDALFVVEREGLIWLVEGGQRSAEPFLDLRTELLSSSIEQGLLGLAFHPDYAANGRLFAYWTNQGGDSVLAEFTAENPTKVDRGTMREIFSVEQPAERHNAGMIAFGPHGFLYLALGDGGSGGAEAQNLENPLGSVVRLDVDVASGEYKIPPGNPFGNEIWIYGLRNPWRFSIDHESELMYIGDVGQDQFEEINVVALSNAGANFGWAQAEGDRCFRSDCDLDQFVKPALQYSHDLGCSVTGGAVYRGAAIPELDGHYFFADWCGGLVRSFRYHQDKVVEQNDWSRELEVLGQVTSFGVGADQEMYVANWGGEIYRIDAIR